MTLCSSWTCKGSYLSGVLVKHSCLLSLLSFCTSRCKTGKVDPAGRQFLLRPMLWNRVMLLLHVFVGLVAFFLPQ